MATRMATKVRQSYWPRTRQEIDYEGFQLVQRRRHHLHESRKGKFVKIEATNFELKEKECPDGYLL